jgi:hypothetical protein
VTEASAQETGAKKRQISAAVMKIADGSSKTVVVVTRIAASN